MDGGDEIISSKDSLSCLTSKYFLAKTNQDTVKQDEIIQSIIAVNISGQNWKTLADFYLKANLRGRLEILMLYVIRRLGLMEPEPYLTVANLMIQGQRFSEATCLLREYLKLSSPDGITRWKILEILFAASALQDCLDLIEDGLLSDAENTDLRFLQCRCLFWLGRKSDAKRALRSVRRLAGSEPSALVWFASVAEEIELKRDARQAAFDVAALVKARKIILTPAIIHLMRRQKQDLSIRSMLEEIDEKDYENAQELKYFCLELFSYGIMKLAEQFGEAMLNIQSDAQVQDILMTIRSHRGLVSF